ncbi:MAG TPA: glycosyltransferase [Bacteroidales bacterium]|nr:glycosyltransferase [Bacteroidales bacterium]HNS47660.1 glycosyltransferase [Bacteroidales bacterium]
MLLRKILLVFPHNPFELRSGIHKRYFELIKYLKERDFSVDLLGLKNFESKWDPASYPPDYNLIDHLFLYDHRKGLLKDPVEAQRSFPDFFRKYFSVYTRSNHLHDFAFRSLRKYFDSLMKKGEYHFIVISYVYWANLVRTNVPEGIVKVLTLEDFLTLTQFDALHGKINTGNYLAEETERVNLFDKVICVSAEEMQFFSRFARNPEYYHIPVFMEPHFSASQDPEYDMVFIGSANYSNKRGMEWFFRDVYPLLDPSLRLLIVGSITESIPQQPNVTCIRYAENLSSVHSRSRISINPLLDGTGMKVKVVEALSFGIPVVSTARGLTGMPYEVREKLLVADQAKNFAEVIHKLISDNTSYQQQIKISKELFNKYFDKKIIYKELDKIFLHPSTAPLHC